MSRTTNKTAAENTVPAASEAVKENSVPAEPALIEKDADAENTVMDEYTVIADRLNLRAGPSLSADITDGAPVNKNTVLSVWKDSETTAEGLVWVEVDFNGVRSWAVKDFLKLITT